MKRIVILGSGEYGRTVKDVAEQLGYTTIVLDDANPAHSLSTFSSYIDDHTEFIPAFCLGAIVKGDNRIERLSKIEAGEVVEREQYPL